MPVTRALHASTYRFQVNRDFPLAEVRARIPYLRALGVGAVYLSPVTMAQPGSVHGYDVCDPTRVNPEAGGEAALEELADALKEAGIGLILDFVPNHMAADPDHNRWWRDVLERGEAAEHAAFFDIDWNPRKPGLRGKVLLPVLEDPYGVALEKGDLRLEARDGAIVLRYRETTFPLNPATLPPELQDFGRGDGSGGTPGRDVEAALKSLNGDEDPARRDALHQLLERQAYRLSNWRTALHEANYRRFFDVSALLGIRMERPEVFEAAHALIRRLAQAGRITGIRVDHVDGLREPAAYLARLHGLLAAARPERPPCILVEKILHEEETLPPDWKADGTTGYEFLSDLNGLFIDPEGLESLRAIHRSMGGPGASEGVRDAGYMKEHIACKRLVLSFLLGSELNLLSDRLDRLSEADPRTRDFTRDDLRAAIRETMACLDVYRTYGRDGFLSPFDRDRFRAAVREAARRSPEMDPSVFAFLEDSFLCFQPEESVDAGEEAGKAREPGERAARLDFALRFQQITGSVQAKGVEDTAFYRATALLSLCEVGSSPALNGTTPARFHARQRDRLRNFPRAMLATSTHDAKRGEDARARLNVLSEVPEAWAAALRALAEAPADAKLRNALAPRERAYAFQTLLGCWPLDARGEPAEADAAFRERVQGALLKAAREAKIRTVWIRPDEEYEKALEAFADSLLRGRDHAALREHLFPLLKECAARGMRNSLAQVACKCAAPGIPDVYQGSEFWDLALVDPDNRRPVDFAAREAALRDMEPWLDPDAEPEGRGDWARALLAHWADGRVKQHVLARCLRWRQRYPELFAEGDYVPVELSGHAAAEVLAFRRTFHSSRGDQDLLVAFPLRTAPVTSGSLPLPSGWKASELRHLFTGTTGDAFQRQGEAALDLDRLFRDFPAAWLWRSGAPS